MLQPNSRPSSRIPCRIYLTVVLGPHSLPASGALAQSALLFRRIPAHPTPRESDVPVHHIHWREPHATAH
jgi:hypothetical protein